MRLSPLALLYFPYRKGDTLMTTQNMPVLALRGLTAFPGQTLSFDAEREISILALENAMEGDRELLLVTQRELSLIHI